VVVAPTCSPKWRAAPVQEVNGDQPSAYDRHTIVHSASTGRLGLSRLGSHGEVTPREAGSLPLPARLADPFPKHPTDSFFHRDKSQRHSLDTATIYTAHIFYIKVGARGAKVVRQIQVSSAVAEKFCGIMEKT
jgi:hypothetical protein